MTKILAIETSCDETAAAICINGKVISHEISSQSIHKQYGGVVPELASREHQKSIVPVVDFVLKKVDTSLKEIHAVAYTQGPGLLGALLVGTSFAKSIAAALDIPLLPVHHLKAHVLALLLDKHIPPFPFLCLVVSGGHTLLVRVKSQIEMMPLGSTLDDAAGETFDKTAKLLGLPYPGGPEIDKLATLGDPDKFSFACPQVPNLQFSFSGVKTSVLYFLRKQMEQDPDFIQKNLYDLAASIQKTIITVLLEKLVKASEQEKIKHVAVVGGVASNRGLADGLRNIGKQKNWETYLPQSQYCTDNAAMIAIAGHYLWKYQTFGSWTDVPMARMQL